MEKTEAFHRVFKNLIHCHKDDLKKVLGVWLLRKEIYTLIEDSSVDDMCKAMASFIKLYKRE